MIPGRAGVGTGMKVEVWSDVVCPWCYIGKRRLEAALAAFPQREHVEVVWRSFELDPTAPRVRTESPAEHLAAKYGMSPAQAEAAQDRLRAVAAGEGLDYHLGTARSGNTFDAHRLIHLAAAHGLGDAMKERLCAAYLVEEKAIGDRDTLLEQAAEVGLDRGEAARVLDGDSYADAVRADEAEAAGLGITGVPFFVIDRAYGVSGAQPAEVLAGALAEAWAASHPLTMAPSSPSSPSGEGGACEGDSCAV